MIDPPVTSRMDTPPGPRESGLAGSLRLLCTYIHRTEISVSGSAGWSVSWRRRQQVWRAGQTTLAPTAPEYWASVESHERAPHKENVASNADV